MKNTQTEMINKEYWDRFYLSTQVTGEETDFSRHTLEYINKNKVSGKLLDIACGNGRDSLFFSKNGINTTGIDISIDLETEEFCFIKQNLFDHDFLNYDIFYLRFVVHALKEEEFDTLINKLEELKKPYHIFIETRSSKGITEEDKSETFFKSSVGAEHFRMLYSKDYLDNKLSKHFNILSSEESNEFAIYGKDKPYCIRYVLSNK